MDDAVDLLSAARGAIFRALSASPAAQLAAIYTEVPEGAKAPFFKIGTIEAEDVAAKGDALDELTIDVIAVDQGESRGRLLQMVEAARRALHRQPIAAAGAALRPPRCVVRTVSDAASDGVTYAGMLTFRFHAQPA